MPDTLPFSPKELDAEEWSHRSAHDPFIRRLFATVRDRERQCDLLLKEKSSEVNHQLAEDLASERERRTFAQEACAKLIAERDELQRQLADARKLLDRAHEIVRSAYRVPEWLRYGRTEETDETLDMLYAAREKEPHA